MIEQQDPREAECLASLAALSKFSELMASASQDENYLKIIADSLQAALQHGVQVSLDGVASEKDTENLVQIRTWRASIATDYGKRKQQGGMH